MFRPCEAPVGGVPGPSHSTAAAHDRTREKPFPVDAPGRRAQQAGPDSRSIKATWTRTRFGRALSGWHGGRDGMDQGPASLEDLRPWSHQRPSAVAFGRDVATY